jgi:hypothetical protein
MVEQIFGALFIIALTAPAAAVVAGVAMLLLPGRTSRRQATVAGHAHA